LPLSYTPEFACGRCRASTLSPSIPNAGTQRPARLIELGGGNRSPIGCLSRVDHDTYIKQRHEESPTDEVGNVARLVRVDTAEKYISLARKSKKPEPKINKPLRIKGFFNSRRRGLGQGSVGDEKMNVSSAVLSKAITDLSRLLIHERSASWTRHYT
jgi:hypothetical protein